MVVASVDEVSGLTVARLKEELAARGLSKEGVKAVLAKRLVEHMTENEAEAEQEETEAANAEETAAMDEDANAEAPAEAETAPAEEPATETEDKDAVEAGKENADASEKTEEAATKDDAEGAAIEDKAEEAATEDKAEETATEDKAEEAANGDKAKEAATEDKAKEAASGDKAEEAAAGDKAEETAAESANGAAATEKAPESPDSTGGDDGPPSKKAKTANGATTTTPRKMGKVSGDPNGREIFIEGIPETATDDDVKAVAEEFGPVSVGAMRVMRTADDPPKCKGLALIRYLDRDVAKKAVEEMSSKKIDEKELSARPSSNNNTLFIGNLNKTWGKEAVLKAFMETVEGIVNFELTMDGINKSQNRGFGFATFETEEACKAAHSKYFKDKLKILDNQVLIDWAETRGNKQDDDRGVYVLNVSEEVEEAVFKAHFEQHGTIEKIVYGKLIPHARRNDFAIVNYTDRESAKKCIAEMHGTSFMGKDLEITMARAKRKRDVSGGGHTGGRGGGRGGGGRGGGYNQGRGGGGG
ncbi:unnamed protein product, partial [Sphacelaria rigidula]